MNSPPHLIEAEGLRKHYGKTIALDGLDLAVAPGTVLGLLGPNGAGKTTAVRILATLLRPDGGSARVAGFDVARQPEKVRPLIGLTGQYAAVDEDLTGRENLLLIGRLLSQSRTESRRRADELLERFGLAESGGRLVKGYSGGMRRRLDLAVSLVGSPSVLFLDEPTTGLDPAGRAGVWDLVHERVAEGMTVLLTTQYLDEADRLAARIAVIDHGRAIADGTPAELKARVGGQTLDVRLAVAEPASDRIAQVQSIVAAACGSEPVLDASAGLVSAPVAGSRSGSAALRAVADRLDAAGIEVTELGLRLASLDEVFLTLTGRQAQAKAEAKAKAKAAQPEGRDADVQHTAVKEGLV